MSSEGQPYEDDVEVHFPVTVMQRRFHDADQVNKELLALIQGLEDEYRDSTYNAVKGGRVSTEGGYQTSDQMNLFLLKTDAVKRFRDEYVLPAVRDYFDIVFKDQAQHIDPWLMGWANVLNEGDWQRPHLHPTEKNLASAVYYLQVPEDKPEPQGYLEFINPNLNSVHHGYVTSRRIKPQQSLLVMFPPYYMHYVHPFKGAGDRVIIAFDALSSRPGMQLVF